MCHELPQAHKNLYGGLILGVNTLYRLFCYFKLFPKVDPLLTIGNSLKKQKSLYKVLTPSIKPHINSYGHMGAHDAYMHQG